MQQKRERVMNVTLYRKTIRSKRERVSSLGIEPLMARIMSDAKRETVEAIRARAPRLSPSLLQQYDEQLPRVCPGVDTHRRRNGSQTERYTGIVLLEFNDLAEDSDIQDIKQRAAGWPTTLAAITGCSGTSVKVLVRGTLDDGSLPEDEVLIKRFHTQLYNQCAKVYATVCEHELRKKTPTPKDVFRWTHDEHPVFTPDAPAIRISLKDLMGVEAEQDKAHEFGKEAIKPSLDNIRRYAMQFALAVRQMREEYGIGESREEEEKIPYTEQLHLIATKCADMDIPVSETFQQSRSWTFHRIDDREQARAIIESAYLSRPRKGAKGHGMQDLTKSLQAFMNERYDLRYNELSNGVEYRANSSSSFVFQPLDTRVMNTMSQEAQEHGIDVFDRDMKRFLGSTRVRDYNIARAYLREVNDKWDKKTDFIGTFADRVPNRNPHWREWFHTWFLGMVAQWEGYNPSHGNAVAPLLIGQQGCGKSTFGQLILPPELRQVGYQELVDFSSKKEVERMLTTSLLINLDEFNQISEKIQQGFLKNLLQKSSVKGRRPYSSVVLDMPRMASFVATSNMTDILNDPSGSRRFIVAEISEGQSIDTTSGIPYDSLYSQAVQELYVQHRRCYFTPEEVTEIEEYNRRYANQRPEVSRFLEVFEPTVTEDGTTRWMSVSEIAAEVHKRTRFEYSNKATNYLGRWLTAESRAMRLAKKTRHGYAVYSVSQRLAK